MCEWWVHRVEIAMGMDKWFLSKLSLPGFDLVKRCMVHVNVARGWADGREDDHSSRWLEMTIRVLNSAHQPQSALSDWWAADWMRRKRRRERERLDAQSPSFQGHTPRSCHQHCCLHTSHVQVLELSGGIGVVWVLIGVDDEMNFRWAFQMSYCPSVWDWWLWFQGWGRGRQAIPIHHPTHTLQFLSCSRTWPGG